MKIAGIVGSINKNSISRKVLFEAKKYFSDDVELSEINIDKLPMFSVDIEFPTPSLVLQIRQAIKDSDGLIFMVPEYNLSFSAALKNVLDWLSRPEIAGEPKPILNKPVLVISTSAGVSGGMVPQEEVRSILNYLGAAVMSQPRVAFASVYSKLDPVTHEIELDETSSRLYEGTIEQFEEFVNRYQTQNKSALLNAKTTN